MTTAMALAGGLAATVICFVYLERRFRRPQVQGVRLRGMRKAALLVGAVLGLVNVAAGSAWAVSSSQATAWTYQGQYMCTRTHIYINNVAAQPHLDAYGAAFRTDIYNGVWYGCNYNNTYIMDPYQLRTREDLYVWNGRWVACNYGPFLYNRSSTWLAQTSWNPFYPCGRNTWYFDSGYGASYNGQWLGGWTQTPQAVYVGN
jgi:hypothetical protein